MKRHPLFCALVLALPLAVATPAMAAPQQHSGEVKALHALVDKQQQQIDVQQREIQMLRDSVMKLQSQQAQQHAQIQAQARTAPPAQPVAAAPAAPTPSFSTSPGVSVAMHGLISATAFHQNRGFYFGNGQNAEFPLPGDSNDGSRTGGDVRNTRLWFDITGPKLSDDWLPSAHLETDFFGGFNGSGAFSQQQATPRLRQAYVDLTRARTGTKVRIGQQWDLMFPIDNVPASLAHIAFPLGFGAGFVGWRFPGVVLMQDLNHGTEGAQWRLDLGAFEGSWSGPGNNIDFGTAGNPGFRPQLEARLHVKQGDWLAYLAAHYSKIDLAGVGGDAPTPVKRDIKSVGYELGGAWNPGPWMFKGQVYGGKGMGELFGGLVQFGDIAEKGGFLQAGYHFTPNWSASAFYGYSKPDTQDVIRWLNFGSLGRLKNRQAALDLQYSNGPYALGLEWMHATLDSTTDGLDRDSTSGNQISVSALYKF